MSLAYLVNLVRDPNIASITPTSRFGVKKICDKMDFGRAKVVVEYGPATGVFTRYMLEHMSTDAKLVAIDTNANFLKVLRERITDPRLSIFHDTAENIKACLESVGCQSTDYVISGIPFSMLPPEVADRIVKNTLDALTPGGKFLIYQFLKPETKTNRGIHRYLPSHFQKINREVELLNIPPLWIYEAIKTA